MLLKNIGSVVLKSPVILAPMAGITDFPFRQTVRQFGCGLVVSEMTASRAVIESFKNKAIHKRMHFFDSAKEVAPVSIQLAGYDPVIMAEAAKFNEQLGASLIDINMGCPVKKVVNTDAGAALMKDEALAGRIIEAVVKAVQIPVTVKMRLGWDQQHLNAATLAKIAQDSGAQAVTVHARTRSQFYEGHADWNALRPVKDAIQIPLIGNGDVQSIEDAQTMLAQSSADAVMIGRGACGKPWLLRQIDDALRDEEVLEVTPHMRYETILSHLDLIMEMYGEEKGVLLARKHLGWYSKGMSGSANFRLAVNAETSLIRLKQSVDQFFVDF